SATTDISSSIRRSRFPPAPLIAGRGFCKSYIPQREGGVMGAFRSAAVISLALAGGGHAAELKIVDVKAYAFLEHAGKLSDDLISNDQSLVDAPRGGALGGDTATGVFLDFTFEGDKNAS